MKNNIKVMDFAGKEILKNVIASYGNSIYWFDDNTIGKAGQDGKIYLSPDKDIKIDKGGDAK